MKQRVFVYNYVKYTAPSIQMIAVSEKGGFFWGAFSPSPNKRKLCANAAKPHSLVHPLNKMNG